MPAIAKDAASIMLLRDAPGRGGMEVLMVRRHARSDFAPDVYVFPGGMVEESDCEEGMAELCEGMGPDDAMSIITDAPSAALALGLFVAGIRETFEETGILLAREATGEFVSCLGEKAARFAFLREAARDESISFREMVIGESLKLATDSLKYFAHWITPELSPIRFDTRFFLSPAPPCQEALHDDLEITGHVWITPEAAIAGTESGTFPMLPPTVINLMALAGFQTTEDALNCCTGEEIAAILPKISFEGGKLRLVLPEDPDYS